MYGLFEANVGGKGVYRDTGNFGAKIEDLMKGAHPNYPHWKLQEKYFKVVSWKNAVVIVDMNRNETMI